MQDGEGFEKIEGEIRKIRYNLENTEMSASDRLKVLNVLRYDTSLVEDRDKEEKVRYNAFTKELECSESVQIGKVIAMHINEEIRKAESIEEKQELYKVMQETYYYLARYLFEYYLPALEFGIPPEKQFIAPRSMVLNKVAREYTKFYYRTDRPIMTVSMPPRNGENADIEGIFIVGDRERSRQAQHVCKLFGIDSEG